MKTNVEEISQYLRTFQQGSDCLEPAVVADVATVAVAFSLSLLFVLARCSWKVEFSFGKYPNVTIFNQIFDENLGQK